MSTHSYFRTYQDQQENWKSFAMIEINSLFIATHSLIDDKTREVITLLDATLFKYTKAEDRYDLAKLVLNKKYPRDLAIRNKNIEDITL